MPQGAAPYPAGARVRAVLVLALSVAYLAANTTPVSAVHSFSLSPTSGPVGTQVAAAPSGFTSAQPYQVYWDWQSDISRGTKVADGIGTNSTNFNVPAGAVAGDHTVNVCLNCGGSAPHWATSLQTFLVTAPTPAPTRPPTPVPTPKPTDTPPPVTHAPTATGMATVTPTPSLPPVATVPPTPIGGIIAETPTPEPLDLADSGEVVDLEVWAVEVTQGIQNLSNDMPLVADRLTAVRVYVRTDGKTTLDIVSVALGGWRDGDFLGVLTPENGPIAANVNGGNRLTVDDSLYFYLPLEWRSGNVKLKAFAYQGDVNSPEELEPDAEDNFFEVNVEFQEAPDSHIMLAPIHLHENADADQPEHVYTWDDHLFEVIAILHDVYRLNPTARVFAYGGGVENMVYPLLHDESPGQLAPGFLNPDVCAATAPKEWDLSDPCQVLLPLVELDKIQEATEPWAEGLSWYGMVQPDVVMKLNTKTPISISGAAKYGVAYGKMDSLYSPNSQWNISKGATIAHERSHNLGLKHVNCTGNEAKGGSVDPKYPYPSPLCRISTIDPEGYYGFDVYYQLWPYLDGPTVISNSPAAPEPNRAFPLMGYAGLGWIDPYDYCKMLDGVGIDCEYCLGSDSYGKPCLDEIKRGGDLDEYVSRKAPVAGLPDQGLSSAQDSLGYFQVQVGWIEETDEVLFFEVTRVDEPRPNSIAQAELRQAKIAEEGLTSGLRLSLEDSSGSVLYTQPLVATDAVSPHEVIVEEMLTISDLVPFAPGTAFIRVRRGDEILGERAVSTHAPEVQLGSWSKVDGLDVTWQASDADGDLLSFMIQYSPDGGETWRVIANNVRGNSFHLDSLAYLPGSEDGLLRVIANDGVNTTVDDTDSAVSVPNTAPKVAIYAPGDGSAFPQNALVILAASVTDWEDGPLSGSALRWESSIDGALGEGAELQTAQLSPGEHKITLVATDSSGSTGEHEITVTIDDEQAKELPTDEEMERLEEILRGGDGGGISATLGIAIVLVAGIAVAAMAGGTVFVLRARRNAVGP